MGRVTLSGALIETAATDILVVGGGIAGWRAALAARQAGRRVKIAHTAQGASPFVLGVNAALGHEDVRDTPSVFVDDMLRGGYGLNDRPLVEALAEGGAAAIMELAALGVPFAAHEAGRFRQRHLSGNSYPRSLYVPEGTGRLILDCIIAAALAAGVERLASWRALALLMEDGVAAGALLCEKRTERLLAVGASAVVLAAGGIGRIYADSTYPPDVTSDAPALAFEGGARLVDMEFVQFEPTVTVHPAACRGMEMPTAMLGDGAQLRNADGERFMFRYNPEHGEKRLEKARLALAIQREIDEGRGFPDGTVAFDTTVLAPETLDTYIGHCRRLRAAGLDPAREAPRVRPAAHSAMGGVRIDRHCRSDVPFLYACGEAAGGIHGASRLAGNGGGEIVVFGAIAGRSAAAEAPSHTDDPAVLGRTALAHLVETARRPPIRVDEIAALMSRCCGLYRDAAGLARAAATIGALRGAMLDGAPAAGVGELARNRSIANALLGAALVAEAALMREESRGAHQRTDFPEMDDARWRVHIAAARGPDGAPVRSRVPVG